jgi:hypothetical protein
MSMKRSKPRSGGTSQDRDEPSDYFAKPKEPEKAWAQWMEGQADAAFATYSLSSRYEKGNFVMHPKFGKGVVMFVEGTRVEILFEDGTKKLGHAS